MTFDLCGPLRRLALASLAAAIVPAFAATASADEDSAALVRKAIHAKEALNWRGTIALEFHERGSSEATRYRVTAIDGVIRGEIDLASMGGGELVTRDVPEASTATSRGGVAESISMADWDPESQDIFEVRSEALFFRNYAFEGQASDRFLDRDTRVVRVHSRHDLSLQSYRLWLDASTGFAYRVDRYAGDGRLNARLRYESFELLGEAHPAKDLARRLVARSVSLDEARSRVRHLVAPQELPHGFQLSATRVESVGGAETVVLEYTDGLSPIFFLETDTRPTPPPDFSRALPAGAPESDQNRARERAREIIQRLERETRVRTADGSHRVALSRTDGSVTGVLVRSPELTTLALGPLSDTDLVEMLEVFFRR